MTSNIADKERRNQFGEIVKGPEKHMNVESWVHAWEEGKTKFHMPKVHPMLQKHYSKLTKDKVPVTLFLPLCGKSLDLKWLAEQGHKVLGNEAVELGCTQFFEENNIDYEVENMTQIPGKIFKSKDANIAVTLYCCDYFLLNSDILGHIDGVWDRGSFAAMNPKDRKKYCEVMKSLLSSDTVYFLDSFKVDHNIFAGPPFHSDETELKNYFDGCSVKKIDERDAMTDWQRSWGLKEFTEEVFSISSKL